MFDVDRREDLDHAQRAAVLHGDGPLVVVAGAGTGKTTVLTSRVASLLERGVAPERMLLLTFTRRAASAMVSRAAALCENPRAGRDIWGGTFHAVAHRLVAEFAPRLGLTTVSVLDPGEVADLLDLLREEHGLAGAEVRLPTSQTLADIYSRSVNSGLLAREVIEVEYPWCCEHTDVILSLFKAFITRKRLRGLLDFDDLLSCWRALLLDDTVGPRIRARWDWVLVDEYQDMNRVQVDIVRGLRPDGTGLTVVGDDAQAIYGFRGASGAHLHELHSALPDSTVVRLQRNFRSVQPVLDLANVVRPRAEGPGVTDVTLFADRDVRAAKPRLVRCADADSEASAVADAVLAAHLDGVALREQAVLMRAAGNSKALEIELGARKIPYVKFGGIRFVDTAHVRDLVAGLRLVGNPLDELAWYRLLRKHRGIGKAHARELSAALIAGGGTLDLDAVVATAPATSRTSLAATLSHLRAARAARGSADVVESCLAAVRPLVRAHYVDWIARLEDVDRLAGAAGARSDLAAFVAELTLDPSSASSDYADAPMRDEDYLTLSTVHSAKGLEWRAVHLIHAVDGAFPSDMALSSASADDAGLTEEQRLFYVAVTRARDSLTIYTPLRMPTHPSSFRARHVIAKASRFLTSEALELFDVEQPESTHSDAVTAPISGARVEIPTMDELFS